MNCRKIYRLLSAYLDQEVSVQEKKIVEEHLLICPNCRRELAKLENLSTLINQAKDTLPVLAKRRQKLMDAVSQENSWITALKKYLRKVFVPSLATVAACLLLIFGLNYNYQPVMVGTSLPVTKNVSQYIKAGTTDEEQKVITEETMSIIMNE